MPSTDSLTASQVVFKPLLKGSLFEPSCIQGWSQVGSTQLSHVESPFSLCLQKMVEENWRRGIQGGGEREAEGGEEGKCVLIIEVWVVLFGLGRWVSIRRRRRIGGALADPIVRVWG